MAGGRREDAVQQCFEKLRVPGLKGEQRVCKGCQQRLSKVADRLREHADLCPRLQAMGLWRKKQRQLLVVQTKTAETLEVHRLVARYDLVLCMMLALAIAQVHHCEQSSIHQCGFTTFRPADGFDETWPAAIVSVHAGEEIHPAGVSAGVRQAAEGGGRQHADHVGGWMDGPAMPCSAGRQPRKGVLENFFHQL